MDAGRILERGTHAQLLALNGRYARMWTLQRESQDSKDSKDSKEKSGDAESSSEPLSAVSA